MSMEAWDWYHNSAKLSSPARNAASHRATCHRCSAKNVGRSHGVESGGIHKDFCSFIIYTFYWICVHDFVCSVSSSS